MTTVKTLALRLHFFSLEENFDSDLGAYYDALFQVDKESQNIASRDLTVWIEYFTQVVAIELSKIKEKVRKLALGFYIP